MFILNILMVIFYVNYILQIVICLGKFSKEKKKKSELIINFGRKTRRTKLQGLKMEICQISQYQPCRRQLAS